jgi:hypothetical protein
MEFTVDDVHPYVEDEIAVLGMGEAGPSRHSIMLQGSLGEVAGSEREMGWDTYHISIDEDESFYGGIRQCVMTNDSVIIRFPEAAVESLGVDELRLHLALEPDKLAEVGSHLRLILTSGRESERPELQIPEFGE